MSRKQLADSFEVGKAGRLVLADLGLDPRRMLKQCGLSEKLLDSADSRLSAGELFDLWRAVEREVADPCLALRVGQYTQIESFSPSFFATMCSPDFNTAARRLDEYKRLVGIFRWDLTISERSTRVDYWCKSRPDMPFSMGLAQIVFLVSFTRRATRCEITPKRVVLSRFPDRADAYEDWFGCGITLGERPGLLLDSKDARRPFLTRDDQMWSFFEPSLRRDMQEARTDATTRERVEHVLTEFLPNGRTKIGNVAKELAISHRTLQRRLGQEGTNWLSVLDDVRARLACHYLASSDFDLMEISFLLGYNDQNSLYRAFRRWKGTTPEAWRAKVHQSKSV